MKKLKLEDIVNLPNVETRTIEVKEWGVSLEIQGISKATQIELGRAVEESDKDAFDYQRALLKACVVDPVLDDDAIDELYIKDSTIIDTIFLQINEINGFGGTAEAEQF